MGGHNVNPTDGHHDGNLSRALEGGLGHRFCGVLLRVVTGGSIAPADAAELQMTGRRQIHLVALLSLGLAIIWAAPSAATTAQTATAKP